jgi:hypothetical protein
MAHHFCGVRAIASSSGNISGGKYVAAFLGEARMSFFGIKPVTTQLDSFVVTTRAAPLSILYQ